MNAEMNYRSSPLYSLMPNEYFQFKQFRILQEHSGLKVTTDACAFGAWVANIIQMMDQEPKRILDIGSGTGILSLMLAQITEKSLITAVEINEEGCDEANNNFKNSPWSDRLNCHQSPIQNFGSNHPFDLIICNPPFFSDSQKGKLAAKNLALHDQQLPMDELIESIHQLLAKNGTCYMLYPEREMNAFTSQAAKSGLHTHQYVYLKNELNQPIFRVMRRFGFEREEVTATELIIRERSGKYTANFWELMQDFYLDYNNPG